MGNMVVLLNHVMFINIYSEGFQILQTAERERGEEREAGFGENVGARLFWEVLKDGLFNCIWSACRVG